MTIRFSRSICWQWCVELVKFPSSSGVEVETFRPLDNDAGFILNVEGHMVVALKLPGSVAKEIAGQVSVKSGILSRLKSKIDHDSDGQRDWLIVTNPQNALLKDRDRSGILVAEGLTNASGASVTPSNVVISPSAIVSNGEQQTGVFATTSHD